MNLLGFNITRNRPPAAVKNHSSGVLLRQSDVLGPFDGMFKDWVPRKVLPELYEILRETIPILDAGLFTISALDGLLRFDGNASLVAEVEEWANSVRVNDPLIGEIGLQAFVDNLSNETYEQGFAIAEALTSADGKTITQLNVADSKNILFRQTAVGRQVWYKGVNHKGKARDDLERVVDILRNQTNRSSLTQMQSTGYSQLNPEDLMYYSINNENSNPYGTSYLRSCEFVSRSLLTMENATLNAFARFGDPIFHISYKHGKRKLSNEEVETRKDALAKSFKSVIDAKRSGQSADFITGVDADSTIEIQVIGHDNQVLEIKEPMSHVVRQLLAHLPLAPWMLGQNLGTTERLADREVDMVMQDATTRGERKRLPIQHLVETMLRLRGRKFKTGDIKVYFELPNLQDVVKKAQARFLNAQADYYDANNGEQTAGKSACVIDIKSVGSDPTFNKSLGDRLAAHRKSYDDKRHYTCTERSKMPTPILDKLIVDFAAGLTDRWDMVPAGIFRRLGIDDPAGKMPEDNNDQPTAEQIRAAAAAEGALFMDDVSINTSVEQGVIARFMDRAYSAGLLDAAMAVGAETPLGSIIANQATLDALKNSTLKLVRDQVFKTMEADIVTELGRLITLGGNPKDIPPQFREMFEKLGYKYKWRRLARSELAIAYETGKANEWKQQGVKTLYYEPAPDACPICTALKGQYPIDSCPVPVIDTHPNCRCTRRAL